MALMAASAGIAITLAVTSIIAPIIRRIMQNSDKGLHPMGKSTKGQSLVHPAWRWVSDRGLRVPTGGATLACYGALVSQDFPEVEDVIPADDSLLLVLRRGECVSAALAAILTSPPADAPASRGRLHEIAVEYGGTAGPDLPLVADLAGMGLAAYIKRHSGADYRVAFLGFQPGFPYLRGLPDALQMPRRASPRVRVAAGSVAVGGVYTGIYPAAGPGGWHIIGRTAAVLFDPQRDAPALMMPGDRVRFVPQ
jgi:KipI family sensor histidine kinase inhibitor